MSTDTETVAVLATESLKRVHLLATLVGSVPAGSASQGSDQDVRAVHVVPTLELVGMGTYRNKRVRAVQVSTGSVDYVSTEVGLVLEQLCAGNGNMLETVLGTELLTGAHGAELRAMASDMVSKRFAHYYRSYTVTRLAEALRTKSVKVALLALRGVLLGTNLMTTGVLETRYAVLFRALADNDRGSVTDLLERKRADKDARLNAGECTALEALVTRLLTRFDAAALTSTVPERVAAPAQDRVAAWLKDLRKEFF